MGDFLLSLGYIVLGILIGILIAQLVAVWLIRHWDQPSDKDVIDVWTSEPSSTGQSQKWFKIVRADDYQDDDED